MLSALLPHPDYAEDQPLARTILSTHVLYRGFQSGALIGLLVGAGRHAWSARRSSPIPPAIPITTNTTTTSSAAVPRSLLYSSLRAGGLGGAIGVGAMVAMLPLYMRGRTDIEWRDRAWRLLANVTQEQTDDWSLVGSAAGVGAVAATMRSAVRPLGWRVLLGGAGAGGLAAVGAMMGWRLLSGDEAVGEARPLESADGKVGEVVAK